jgi:hypothetical protein
MRTLLKAPGHHGGHSAERVKAGRAQRLAQRCTATSVILAAFDSDDG